MRFNVKVTGLAALQKQIITASEKVQEVCEQEIQAAGQDWVAGAVRDAPVDQGALKGSISLRQSNTNTVSSSLIAVEIVAQKFYAPFMEFGTKGKYQPIPGTEDIAAQFKGYKGGDFDEMVRMLMYWLRRQARNNPLVKTKRVKFKPIYDEDLRLKQAAFGLAIYILKVGINPHPFFFKQGDTVWPDMIRRMQAALQRETKVSVIAPGDISRPNYITI